MNSLRYCAPSLVLVMTAIGLAINGIWIGLGLYIVLAVAFVDAFLPKDFSSYPIKTSFMGGMVLSFYPACFLLLYYVYALQLRRYMDGQAWGSVSAMFVVVSLVTAVTFLPVIHEMVHRSGWVRRVGLSFVSLFGAVYMSNSHFHVHHVETDTPGDTETPYRGENVWRFILRAVKRQHQESWKIEQEMMRKQGIHWLSYKSRIVQGIVGFLIGSLLFVSVSGLSGLPFYILSIGVAMSLQAIYSYIEHYGLVRVPGTPIELRHAWNHLNPLGRAFGVEIASHSAHHVDPDIPYYQLPIPREVPHMPGLYTSFFLTFIPKLWDQYIAKPRLSHWDNFFANAEEKKLAQEANRRAGWTS